MILEDRSDLFITGSTSCFAAQNGMMTMTGNAAKSWSRLLIVV